MATRGARLSQMVPPGPTLWSIQRTQRLWANKTQSHYNHSSPNPIKRTKPHPRPMVEVWSLRWLHLRSTLVISSSARWPSKSSKPLHKARTMAQGLKWSQSCSHPTEDAATSSSIRITVEMRSTQCSMWLASMAIERQDRRLTETYSTTVLLWETMMLSLSKWSER